MAFLYVVAVLLRVAEAPGYTARPRRRLIYRLAVVDEVLVDPATAVAASADVGCLLPHSVGRAFYCRAALVTVDFDDGAVVDPEAGDPLGCRPVWFGAPVDAFRGVHGFVARIGERLRDKDEHREDCQHYDRLSASHVCPFQPKSSCANSIKRELAKLRKDAERECIPSPKRCKNSRINRPISARYLWLLEAGLGLRSEKSSFGCSSSWFSSQLIHAARLVRLPC